MVVRSLSSSDRSYRESCHRGNPFRCRNVGVVSERPSVGIRRGLTSPIRDLGSAELVHCRNSYQLRINKLTIALEKKTYANSKNPDQSER